MNILQIIPELDAGGAERTTLEVAQAITQAGGRAFVASTGGRMVEELTQLGGQFIEMDTKSKNPLVIWRNIKRLVDQVEACKIDLIHARSRAPAWSAYAAARQADVPFVTTYHGTYTANSRLKRVYNSVMARGERVIANSQFIADHVRDEHHVGDDRLRVIPRGVDLNRFDPIVFPRDRKDAMREKWGAGRDDTVILLPARLTAWKGQDFFLDVMASLGADPNIILVFIGDAQGRNAYQSGLISKAQRLNLKLVLTGHENDMPAAYLASDLTVCPSLQPEAFGRTAAEAQAMGIPVIAADHGGAREAVKDGETGWRAKPGDIEAWKNAVRQALGQTRSARVAMALAARGHIAKHYSTTALQEATLQVYKELLE